MRFTRRAALLVVSLLAACSSGKDSPPPPPPPTFTLSGTVQAAAATDADGDNADAGAPQIDNDAPGTAQLLPPAVTVGGCASFATDADDWYRATLAAGQVVTLHIAEAASSDLDLFLYTVANLATPVASSDAFGTSLETVTVPAPGGEYFVRVQAASGSASNYVLTLGQAGLAAPAAEPVPSGAEFVPDELIVTFRPGVLPAGAAENLAGRAASVGLVPMAGEAGQEMLLGLGTGAARAGALAALGVAGVRRTLEGDAVAAAKADTVAALKALRRRPDVLRADLNYIHHPSLEPNDTHYPLQWHYPLIQLPQAWDVSTGSTSVVVAVVDTGVYLAHPDLDGQLVPGYDFILDPARALDGDGVDAIPDDPGDRATPGGSSFHGTHVAGTIAAESNSGAVGGGVAGVGWGTRIMPVRVLGLGGGTTFDIINAVKWAAGLLTTPSPPAQPADVINLSLGCQSCFTSSEQAAYDAVVAAGVVVVAAAGNESSSSPGYPASYSGVISVSAVDMQPLRAGYSNFGPTVDIAAPGGDTARDRDQNGFADGVLSTWVDDSGGSRVPMYKFLQGTSMASPHVAGVVALMKAVCPSLTPGDVDGILSSGGMTVDLGAAGRDDLYGHGLVDGLKAIQSAQAACLVDPSPSLGVTPARLDFGLGTAPRTLAAVKNGTGALANVTAAESAAWLTVTPPAAADGLGTYAVSVTRTGLPSGIYRADITFTAGASSVTVPVTMQVGGIGPGPGDLGHLYVVLTDTSFKTVAVTAANPVSGEYTFSLSGVPAGTYYLFAGSDFDGDERICDAGEACGAYPDVGALAPLEISTDRSGLGFAAGFELALGAASRPAGGLALRPPLPEVSR